MKCPSCGASNPDDVVSCLQCNARLPAEAVHWSGAGAGDKPSSTAPLPATVAVEEAPPFVARLRVEQGSVDQRDFQLDKPVFNIGRRLGNDIVIHDTNVSRQHARLVLQEDGYELEDTDSANGTLLNDERVEELRPLRNGDVIRIGDAVFVYEFDRLRAPEAPEAQPIGAVVAADQQAPEVTLAAELGAFGAEMPGPPVAADEGMGPGEPETGAVPSPDAVPAPPVAAEVPDPAGTPAERPGALDGVQRDLADLGQEFSDLVGRLGALVERTRAIEQSVDQAGAEVRRLEDATRGPAAQPLRDLRGLLDEFEAAGGAQRFEPLSTVIARLAEQPRDIELLLELSRQATDLKDLVGLHARLVEATPSLRQALDRILTDNSANEATGSSKR